MTRRGELAAELARFVAMPTVSAPSPDRAALAAAASWLAHRVAAVGAQRVAVRPAGGVPVVLGERRGPPGAPTVLCYGHFDVVAPGPRQSWSAPPFAGVRRAGQLFGRGAADDKGPVLAQLQAAQADGTVNWKFLYDGVEEVGSPALGRRARSGRCGGAHPPWSAAEAPSRRRRCWPAPPPGAEVLLLGFTLPGNNAHAPDEHVDLARLEAAATTITRLTERLAGSPS